MQPQPHQYYMKMALKQAQIAYDDGEVPAGCVIVHGTNVIGRAHNQVELLKDATAHAEMIALTQAASALGDWRLADTVLYVTKEPCAMCAGAIVLARVPVVVFGAADPQRGGAVSNFNILDNPQLNHRCRIVTGVMEKECRGVLQDFFREQRRKQDETANPSPTGKN